MNIYLIPGLGFDHQIFQKYNFDKVYYIDWIEPQKGESIQEYAVRLAASIPDTGRNTIIGHSLGGILAQEISTFKPIQKLVLISSIKSRKELPRQFKVVKPLALHKLFTKGFALKTVRFWGKKHDYVTPEEQMLFKDMIGKQSNHYLQWALRQLSIWEAPPLPGNAELIQIHGLRDKTFPAKLIHQPDRIIADGGHFMVYKHSASVSEMISETLGI